MRKHKNQQKFFILLILCPDPNGSGHRIMLMKKIFASQLRYDAQKSKSRRKIYFDGNLFIFTWK